MTNEILFLREDKIRISELLCNVPLYYMGVPLESKPLVQSMPHVITSRTRVFPVCHSSEWHIDHLSGLDPSKTLVYIKHVTPPNREKKVL